MTPHPPTGPASSGPAASHVEDTAPEAFGLRIRETVSNFPPVESWDDVVLHDAKAHPRKVEKHYMLVPTTCFNCESACGLLAYVDRDDLSIKKLEGNPAHPGSRGRNCAKGPATVNQVNDPERILTPLRRVGERGSGSFEPVTWDEALDDIAARIRRAIEEDRRDEVIYHVGRPGEDGFVERVLLAWGVQAFVLRFANQTMTAESLFFYMTLAGLLLAPAAWLMTDFGRPVNYGWSGPWLAAAIQVLNSIGELTMVYAFRHGNVIIVSPLINAAAPVITILLSPVVCSAVPQRQVVAGMALAAGAFYLLA